MKQRARPIAPVLALCLALAGCGRGMGSQPVVITGSSPSYTSGAADPVSGRTTAALADVQTTPAGALYLDVTDEMYATGRYGDRPDAAGCISAAQAADLAARYAVSFADHGLEDNVWALHLEAGAALDSSQPLWVCILSLPKWSQDPKAIPNDPFLKSLTQEQLLQLGSPCDLRLYIGAATQELLRGECRLPSDLAGALADLPGYDAEGLQAYLSAGAAWLAGEEAPQAARSCFAAVTGAEAARLDRYSGSGIFGDFIAQGRDNAQYALSLRRETGLLRSFYLLTEEQLAAAGLKGGSAS